MTVDELIAALGDAKRLDPTIGGWEVRMEMTVEYEDDTYRQAYLDGSAIIWQPIGTVVRSSGNHVAAPTVIIRPEGAS